MQKDIFLSRIENISELPKNSLNGSENLKDSDAIDSLALLEILSMLDKEFHINMTVDEILSVGTLDDLYKKIMNNR